MNASTLIATILKHDRKINSYKLALLRSINDVVLSFPEMAAQKTNIAVPLRVLAQYWLSYYWPFMDPDHPIYQGPRSFRNGKTGNDVSFRPEMEKIYISWQQMLENEKINSSDGYFIQNEMRIARKRNEYSAEFVKQYDDAIKKISTAIKMPIRYAGEGEWGVFMAPQKFSELTDIATPLPGTKLKDDCLVISNQLWKGFHQISLYVEALAIHQWSLFLEGVKQGDEVAGNRGTVYEILTARPDNRRPLTWERNRIDVLLMEGQKFNCPWTGKIITQAVKYDIDHIIPVSLYPINELWNLVPSDPDFNSHKKRDKLPSLETMSRATPKISNTFGIYMIENDLADALREEAASRFYNVTTSSFSIRTLTDSMTVFINSFQIARNVATF